MTEGARELPPDIVARIERDYASNRRAEVSGALLDLSEVTREHARVARCVLYSARGDLDRFAQLIELARIDYRDAIVGAEYDLDDQRLRDFSRPFEVSDPG